MKFIELNKIEREKTIQDTYSDCVSQIEINVKAGKDSTDLYIDKDIAPAVRDMLSENISNITFAIVRTGRNPITGRVENYTGKLVGDQRYYKVVIS